MRQHSKSLCLLIATLIISGHFYKSYAETIYIKVEKGDTLSTLLHSSGIIPLYGPGQAVEKYKKLYPETYSRPLVVREYAPIESEDVRFTENLTHQVAKQYSIKQRLRTTAELNRYKENLKETPSESVAATPPAPQAESEVIPNDEPLSIEVSEQVWTRHFLAKVYLTQIERELTSGNLVTKTQSDLQAGVGVEIGLNDWRLQLDYWPWLGESEGLSYDYRAGAIRKNICNPILICELGLAHRRVSFISRNAAGNRRPEYLSSFMPQIKFGAILFQSLNLTLSFEPLLFAEFNQTAQDADGAIYGVGLGWSYGRHLMQFLEFEALNAKSDSNDELKSTRLLTSLSYTF